MKIDIYIQGMTRSPAVQKCAMAGWFISCVLSNGTVETRYGIAVVRNATIKKAVLTALDECLGLYNKAAVLRIYISDDYVRNALISGWPRRWKANAWRKIRLNGEVKYLDLWRGISEKLSNHAVTYARGEELDNKILKQLEEKMKNARGSGG